MNNDSSLHARLLVALFDCASAGRPRNVEQLTQLLGARRASVACALNDCIEGGLLNAENLALTFIGLTLAAKLRRQQALQSEHAASDNRLSSAPEQAA